MEDPLHDLMASIDRGGASFRSQGRAGAPTKPSSQKVNPGFQYTNRRAVRESRSKNELLHSAEPETTNSLHESTWSGQPTSISSASKRSRRPMISEVLEKSQIPELKEKFHLAYTGGSEVTKDSQQELIESLKRNIQHLTINIKRFKLQDGLLRGEIKSKTDKCKELEKAVKELQDQLSEETSRAAAAAAAADPPGDLLSLAESMLGGGGGGARGSGQATAAAAAAKAKAEADAAGGAAAAAAADLRRELSEKAKRVADLQENNQRLIAALARAEKAEALAQAEMDDRWAEIRRLGAENERLAAAAADARAQAALQALPLRTLEAETRTLSSQVEQMKKKLSAEREKYNQLHCAAAGEREEARRRAAAADLDRSEAARKHRAAREQAQRVEALEGQQAALRAKAQQLEGERSALAAALAAHGREAEERDRRLQELQAELGQGRAASARASAGHSAAEELRAAAEARARALQEQLDAQTDITESSSKVEKELRNQISDLERKYYAHKRAAGLHRNLLQAKEAELEQLRGNSLSELEVRRLRATKEELLVAIDKLVQTEDASENIYSCLKCLEVFQMPMTCVPCGHTFCARCLDPSLAFEPGTPQTCHTCGPAAKVQQLVRNAPLEALCAKFKYRQGALKAARRMAEGLQTSPSQPPAAPAAAAAAAAAPPSATGLALGPPGDAAAEEEEEEEEAGGTTPGTAASSPGSALWASPGHRGSPGGGGLGLAQRMALAAGSSQEVDLSPGASLEEGEEEDEEGGQAAAARGQQPPGEGARGGS